MRRIADLIRHPVLRSREFRQYLCGHGCVAIGAGVSGAAGSMWPLALGASASLVLTVPLLRRLRRRRAPRRCR